MSRSEENGRVLLRLGLADRLVYQQLKEVVRRTLLSEGEVGRLHLLALLRVLRVLHYQKQLVELLSIHLQERSEIVIILPLQF